MDFEIHLYNYFKAYTPSMYIPSRLYDFTLINQDFFVARHLMHVVVETLKIFYTCHFWQIC